ncbi:MAG TPA: hypothetical protein VGI71_14760 [Scandinavium sp.]|jgi:type 1 fimbria pilin
MKTIRHNALIIFTLTLTCFYLSWAEAADDQSPLTLNIHSTVVHADSTCVTHLKVNDIETTEADFGDVRKSSLAAGSSDSTIRFSITIDSCPVYPDPKDGGTAYVHILPVGACDGKNFANTNSSSNKAEAVSLQLWQTVYTNVPDTRIECSNSAIPGWNSIIPLAFEIGETSIPEFYFSARLTVADGYSIGDVTTGSFSSAAIIQIDYP